MNQFAALISWTPSTGTLTYSVNGVTQTATVQTTTTPRLAAFNRFRPGDPVRPLVARWNNLIQMTSGRVIFGETFDTDVDTFSMLTSALAAHNADMQLHLQPNTNVVASLRPVPFLPLNPI
ncbi:hypothetical protein [Alteribacter natronophilus]|uniref:hypothetical protein n=1 Tax=Alteribacter natronophilus TaxID=2583810 RepID=UPI00110ED55B|nr:hypothetical protein [Alteribacter natronophilus]TMW71406.1 hypothetical protein FGB90_10160 [Alteribacter natronophilus]